MSFAYETDEGTIAIAGKLTSIPEGATYLEIHQTPNAPRETWRIVDGSLTFDSDAKSAIESEEALQKAKEARTAALDSLVHDFGDGRIMQTRPKDEANILRAIKVLTKYAIPTVDWVMLDNVKYPTTAEELETAMEAGILAGMQVWADYAP